jgi:hypothetical protein
MASVYTRMADMTEADLSLLDADAETDAAQLPGRLMDAVAELEQFKGALKVTRLVHVAMNDEEGAPRGAFRTSG